ncbi:MAG: DUF3108 domain-containing protein [Candidatus Accumulibacter sp.]|nr:DUF3108 domain-containing protein [Accumulibacter sp.]
MPVALLIAFAASLGMHALVAFGPEIDLPTFSEPPPLAAELKPPAAAAAPRGPATPPAAHPAAVARSSPTRAKPATPPVRQPLAKAPDAPSPIPSAALAADAATEGAADVASEVGPEPASSAASPTGLPAAAASSLPARGRMHYRVDRGDQGFQIGFSIHEWEVVDGAYRISAVSETSGLVAFFKPLRVELESRGRLTVAGLVPERFVARRQDRKQGESVEFDWANAQLRMRDRPVQALHEGAQDPLSYSYQLGLLPERVSGSELSIATGRKYANFRLEVVGDEEIEIPAGTFRSLHLRIPGVATTELWLAYDRALLPVKIQYVDRQGQLYVQVATAIEFSQEP